MSDTSIPKSISELVQFKIVEKPYEVKVPKFVEVEVEKVVYVEKKYEVPVIVEKTYEKPIIEEKPIMTSELIDHIKAEMTRAISQAVADITFNIELPMPRVVKVGRKT